MSTAGAVVDLIDVAFGYRPGDRTLDSVNLQVRPGESVALVGPSGSGKTTLLHCCAGLLEPSAGVATVCGVDLVAARPSARRQLRLHRLGVVLQDGQLLPELSVLENVALPARLRGEGRKQAEARAEVALRRLDLGGLGGRRPAELSGGQYQRVAVARATAGAPKLILADEPTGALDSVNRTTVFDLLLACGTELGAAVVVVTHDSSLAERCGRQVDVLDGRLLDV